MASFKQTPDNLRSTDTFEGILGLAVGPLKGPVNGLNSIELDGTPVEDTSGTLNFQDTVIITADGSPAKFPQIVTPQLGAAGSPVSVNLTIGNTNPAGTPGPFVVKTASSTGAAFLDLRFVVQQLYAQTKDGIFGTTANLEIQLKPTAKSTWITPQLGTPSETYSATGQTYNGNLAAWIPRKNYTVAGTWVAETNNGYLPITGKTTSPYVYELRIAVPNTGAYANTGWDVRVRLREPASVDADPNFEKRNLSWESLSPVFPDSMGNHEDWRGVGWMQIVAKASDQLSGLPEVTAVYDTKIVQVPPATVFNPTTRAYSGTIWDGSWASAYTNDPAWVINDALSDSLSGVSLIAAGSHLNKWDALEASKFFSELVPDGAGGMHPRYSMNLIIDQPQKAEDMIPYIAGAVGGFAWDSGNGEWRLVVDKNSTPVDIFTLENIVGEFQYSHTDIDARYNDIKMTFLNEANNYEQDFVQVFDSPSIAAYGRKPTSVVAVGCTNRQEALRRAMVRLRSSINETRMVSFSTNRRGRLLQQFSTILVADADLGNRTSGRVVSVAGDRLSVTLRDTVRLEVGVSYKIRFTLPNPVYNPDATTQPTSADYIAPTLTTSINLTNTSGQRGDVKILYLASALPSTVAEYLTVALEANDLPTTPKLYRVIDIKPGEGESAEFASITAIEVDTGKQAAADGVSAIDTVISTPPEVVPAPVTPATGKALSLVEIPNNYTLIASWRRPDGNWIAGYQVKYRVNGGPWVTAVENTKESSIELLTAPTGIYDLEVRSIDRLGRYSTPLTDNLNVTGYDGTSLTMALTRDSVTLAADNNGVVSSFSSAAGAVNVFYGTLNVTAQCTFTKTAINCTGTVDTSGNYAVSALSADTGSLTITATYNSISISKTFSLAKARAGVSGSSSVSGYLTNDSINLFAYADGTVTSYTPATGSFKALVGSTDVSSSFTLSTLANPQALTIAYASQTYTITGGFDANEDTASITIRATGTGTYAGVVFDKVLSLSKAKGGYEIVSTLPSTNLFAGRVVFLTTDNQLYRYTGSAWTTAVPAANLSGSLTSAQIASLDAAKLTGTVGADLIGANTIVASKMVLMDTNNLLADPTFLDTGNDSTTAYWYLGTPAWTVQTDTADAIALVSKRVLKSPTGSSGAVHSAYVNQSRISVEAGKSYRAFTNVRVSAGFTGLVRLQIRWFKSDGTTASPTSASSLVTVTGGDFRTTAATAVTLLTLEGVVTAPADAAYARFDLRIDWSSTLTNAGYAAFGAPRFMRAMSAELIVDGSVTANALAANSVTASAISAGSVTAAKVDTTNAVITGTAQIANSIITAAKITDATITTAKIGDLQVDTIKIKDSAISSTSSAYTAASAGTSVANTFVTVQTLSVTTAGGSCVINGSVNIPFALYTSSTQPAFTLFQIRLLRDGTAIYTANLPITPSSVNWNVALNGIVPVVMRETPTATTHSYQLQVKLPAVTDIAGASGITFANAFLSCTELLK